MTWAILIDVVLALFVAGSLLPAMPSRPVDRTDVLDRQENLRRRP